MQGKKTGRTALGLAVLACLTFAFAAIEASRAATHYLTIDSDGYSIGTNGTGWGTGEQHTGINGNTLTTNHGLGTCTANWDGGWVLDVINGGTAQNHMGGGGNHSGTLNVDGSTAAGNNINMYGAVNVRNSGTMGGTGLTVHGAGNVTVTGGGKITSDTVRITGTMTVANGTVTNDNNYADGSIKLTGGSITASDTNRANRDIDASNGAITGKQNEATIGSITAYGSGTLKGSVVSTTDDNYAKLDITAKDDGEVKSAAKNRADRDMIASGNGKITATTDNVAGNDMKVSGNGQVVATANNSVGNDLTISGDGKVSGVNNTIDRNVAISGTTGSLIGTGLNKVGGDVDISGQGKMDGKGSDIGGNVKIAGSGQLISGADEGKIKGNLTIEGSGQIFGVHSITGFAHTGGTGVINDNLTVVDEIQVTGQATVKNGVDLKSTGSYVEMSGQSTTDRVLVEGSSDITANSTVAIDNVENRDTIVYNANTGINVNQKAGDRDTTFGADNELISAGGDIKINKVGGGDIASFGTGAVINAKGGDVTIEKGSSFAGNAVITASQDAKVDGSSSLGNTASVTGGRDATVSNSTAGSDLTVTATARDATVSNVAATNDMTVSGGRDATVSDVSAGSDLSVTATNRDATVTNVTATTDMSVSAGRDAKLDGVNAGDDMSVAAVEDVDMKNSSAGDDLTINTAAAPGKNVTLTDTKAGKDMVVNAGDDVTISGTAAGRSEFGADAEISAGKEIKVSGSTFGKGAVVDAKSSVNLTDDDFLGDSHVIKGGDDVTLSGVKVESGTGANASKIESTNGTVAIKDSSARGSDIASNTTITAGDDLKISGPKTTLEDDIAATVGGETAITGGANVGDRFAVSGGTSLELSGGSHVDDSFSFAGTGAVTVSGGSSIGDGSKVDITGVGGKILISGSAVGEDAVWSSTTSQGIEIRGEGGAASTIGENGTYTVVAGAASGGPITVTGGDIKGSVKIKNLGDVAGDININMTTGYTSLGNDVEISSASNGKITVLGRDATDVLKIGDNALIHNKEGDVGVQYIDAGNGLDIHTDKGSLKMLDSTVGEGAKFYTTGAGNIEIRRVDADNNFDSHTGAGNIVVSDSAFKNNAKIITNGDGSIAIDKVTAQDKFTSHTTAGNVSVTNSTLGHDALIYTTGLGNLTLENLTMGKDGHIYTGGGDVLVNQVATGTGTVIETTGTAGKGHNNWTLKGNNTDVRGTILLNGDEDIVEVLEGYYHEIVNETGYMQVDFKGGIVRTIDNSTAGAGDSQINLISHDNTKQPASAGQPQSIKYIKGNNDAAPSHDAIKVSSGVRFTEYADHRHNYANPAGAGHDSTRDPITNHISGITKVDLVELDAGSAAARTGLEIGTRDTRANDVKFEAKHVTMGDYSDLFIHATTATEGGSLFQHKSDLVEVEGRDSVLWIDRTTLTSYSGAPLLVDASGSGAMVTGFQNRNAAGGFTAHNIDGDLYMGSGTIIKPYSIEHEDYGFMVGRLCSVTSGNKLPLFHEAASRTGQGMSISDDLTMSGGTTLDIRIFSGYDAGHSANVMDYDQYGNLTGTYTPTAANSSDFVSAGDVAFTNMADLNVTFGNDNELGAKTGDAVAGYSGFKVYRGDGVDDHTYYYSIVRSGNDIVGYAGLNGTDIPENALFDQAKIFKSDMLGNWDTLMGGEGDEVLLRFRLLAKHPTQGGIAIDMEEPNAAAAARQIDRIRYPFDHNDPHVRYDGNMMATYEELNRLHPGLYPNYDPNYIADFQNLLKNVQQVIVDGGDMNAAMRRLHPEPYADLANVNSRILDQFHRTREQHGISSLFMVEANLKERVFSQIEGTDAAYASMDLEECGAGQFVRNPIRFWASGFGADGRQRKIGTEYGYDSEVWGGAVGVTKEWNDWYVGLSGGYARVNTSWEELTASAKTDAYIADAVIGLRRGLGFIEAFGSYAYADQKMSRSIYFPGGGGVLPYTGTARGEYHDNVWSAGLRLGYQQVFCDSWLFVPTIGVNYVESKSGKFSEEGRQHMSVLLDFEKGGIKRRNVRVPLMARVNKSFAVCDYVVTPEVRGAVTGYFGDKRAKATTRFIGDPSGAGHFEAVGAETGRWAAQVGASIELSRRGRFTLTGNYDFTFSKKSREHNYSLMMGVNF